MADKEQRPLLDWLGLVLALIVAAAAGSALWWQASTQDRQYQIEAQDRAADYTEASRNQAQIACASAQPPNSQSCIDERAGSARPDQRNEYDLEAQRTMATWTRAMGYAAIIGMSVGIFGLALIFVTFRETRRAASTSIRTYQAFIAAEDASLVIEFPRGRKIETVNEGVKQPDSYPFDVGITNMGRSTARIHGFSVDGRPYFRKEHTLNPGDTWFMEQSVFFEPIDGYFALGVRYSSPLSTDKFLDVTAKLGSRRQANGATVYFGRVKRAELSEAGEHLEEERHRGGGVF